MASGAVVLKALGAVYNVASNLGRKQAEEALRRSNGNKEKAADKVIKSACLWGVGSGFSTNFGGFATMSVSIPADLTALSCIQLRMSSAIAHIGGYDVDDENVRAFCYLVLIGSSAEEALQKVGVEVSTKTLSSLITKIPRKVLVEINKQVGYRLVTKAGKTGVINFMKVVPFVAAATGGGINYWMVRSAGKLAKKYFLALDGEE